MLSLLKYVKRKLKLIYFELHQIIFSVLGAKVECNICNYKTNQFNSDPWHAYSICPRCESSIRQRLLWMTLNQHNFLNVSTILSQKIVLHFAPEKILRNKIKSKAKLYHSADFFAEGYHYPDIDYSLDISNMAKIESQFYDCLIACDVLEHVADDKKALQEIYRVLKPGGYCILTVPQKDHLKITDEDLSIISPKEREIRFGQSDHLRIYGQDFENKMQQAGFKTEVVDEKYFSNEQVSKHVLFPLQLSTHPMATNYRKIFFGQKK